jgi:ribosome-binding factor A
MKRTRRTERLSGLLLQEISSLLLREVNDPRVRAVTFTAVDVTPDLRLARVFFSVLDPERQQEDASQGLDSAKGLIKRALGPRLSLRYMPDLEFIYDASIQRAERIDNLLKTVRHPEA